MKKHLARGLVALFAATFGLLAITPSSAQAVTWVRTAKTTHSAYSWNGYKAKIEPSAAPAVTAYSVIDKRISVKSLTGTTLSTNVTSRWTAPGTYTVYSTFKYRRAWPYTAKKTVTYNVLGSTLNSCTLTDVSGSGYSDWQVGATCSVTLTDFEGHSVTTTVSLRGLYLGMDDPVVGLQTTDIYEYESSLPGTFSKTVSYTAYKYTYVNRYRVRTVSVAKVANYSTVTWNEYGTIKAPWDGGDSLARVRSVFGSNGTRITFMESDGNTYSGYQWKNTSGGYVYVTFENGLAYSKTWMS